MTRKSYHLRWNNHLQNLQNLFENLYNEQNLVDVTVSCTDGLLYGHKLVLTACSPYFEQIFKDNPCKHPVIILKGINKKNMQLMLQYMYTGSIDVAEEDLEVLLDAAAELQIKGLGQSSTAKPQTSEKCNVDKLSNSTTTEGSNNYQYTTSVPQPASEARWQTEPSMNTLDLQYQKTRESTSDGNESVVEHELEDDEEMEEIIPQFLNTDNLSDHYQDNSEDDTKDYTLLETLEDSPDNVQNSNTIPDESKTITLDDVTYFCHICARGFLNKTSYHRHMLTHAGVKPHSCTFCSQSFLRLSHLQRHIRVHTGERPYSCGICSKPFARSDKLRQHYIIQHNTNTARGSKPRGRPRKYGINEPLAPVVPKIPRPRGRPRKHHQFYPPIPSTSVPTIDSVYSVNMNGSVPVVAVNGLHQPVPS